MAQAVFILLARKAARLRKTKNLVLGGWLYRTTRFVAARALRGELRRQRREQEAFQMQQFSSADETWRRIAPMLDEGIEQLDQTDRDAVILRFFQDEPLHAVGGGPGHQRGGGQKTREPLAGKTPRLLRPSWFHHFGRRAGDGVGRVIAPKPPPPSLAGAIAAKALAHAASSSATLPVLVAETLAAWRWAKVKILAGFCVPPQRRLRFFGRPYPDPAGSSVRGFARRQACPEARPQPPMQSAVATPRPGQQILALLLPGR